MHIVIADALSPSAADAFLAHGWTVDTRSGRKPAELARDLAAADALIVRSATQVTSELLAAAPRLRVVARAGTGVDNVDLPAASARGVLVMNAAGANSVSVAELTMALLLSLARNVPAADASMKAGAWEKKRFTGTELRGKVLGIIGFGRIGREVAHRARAFGMEIVAYDPFVSPRAAETIGVPVTDLETLLQRADVLTLHVPAVPETRHLLNAERLSKCRRGVRIVNTARGELIDEAALADAIESGQVAGAALDVFEVEPPVDRRLVTLPQVIATPHIAASTAEAQELVGLEIVMAVRDYLADGLVRNAVNFPPIAPEDFPRVRPFLALAETLGSFAAQMSPARPDTIGIRYYGELASRYESVLGSAAISGVLSPVLNGGLTMVNARALAEQRGIDVVESRSSRPRDYVNVISIKLQHAGGERWVEGALFDPAGARLCTLDGVEVEVPLNGTMVVVANEDRPGVVGELGSALGRHGVNIGSLALGRGPAGAVGVINVDDAPGLEAAVAEIRALGRIHDVRIVRL